jgi:hypothetical protein
VALYRTELEVGASDERVWAVLTDFGSYPDWNPSLPSISGELQEGSTLSLTLGMPGRPNPKVTATLREVAPNRRLTWHGNVGADRIFAGDREFEIQPLSNDRILFTHVEHITGMLAPVFELLMGSSVQRSHDEFNESLRRRAETGVSGIAQ